MRRLEGSAKANGLKFGVIVSKFNQQITSALLEGALSTLKKSGVEDDDITVVYVPGAFEIPLLAKNLAVTDEYDAIITLGCVIRGETAHFDQICNAVSAAIQQLSLETGIPICHGVLMTENEEQAETRAGGSLGNRGEDAARAAVETATLMQHIFVSGA